MHMNYRPVGLDWNLICSTCNESYLGLALLSGPKDGRSSTSLNQKQDSGPDLEPLFQGSKLTSCSHYIVLDGLPLASF